MSRIPLILVLASCGSLPPPGSCDVPVTGAENVTIDAVALFGAPATFDDLQYSRPLGKLIAPPEDTGHVYVIDPDTLAVQIADVPTTVGSGDASATTIYVADRAGQVIAIDPITMRTITTGDVPGAPDYLRVSPTTGEVWVSIPQRNRLEILDPKHLTRIGSVIIPGPIEGLAFDTSGRAYVNTLGQIVAVDVLRRTVVGEWDRGCKIPHGFPQIDKDYGLAFGGCFSNGGAGVVSTAGDLRAGFEAGGGEAVLAYDPVKHHLYLRGDPGDTLDILAVCPDGELGVLAAVAVPNRGHVSSADDRGHVWTADATTGGVVRITDPFPGTN